MPQFDHKWRLCNDLQLMGAEALRIAEKFGLPGLVGLVFVGTVWCCAKPFFKFLTDDRQNARKHQTSIDRARARAEEKGKVEKKVAGQKRKTP